MKINGLLLFRFELYCYPYRPCYQHQIQVHFTYKDDPLANDVAQHWKDNEAEAVATGLIFINGS
jgi:hypothetical protein